MNLKHLATIGLGSFALCLWAAPSQADPQHDVSVRNETGRVIGCWVRRAGSSATDDLTLRKEQVWTSAYSGSKRRMIRCEGELSDWQPLEPDRSYALVQRNEDRIVAEPVQPR